MYCRSEEEHDGELVGVAIASMDLSASKPVTLRLGLPAREHQQGERAPARTCRTRRVLSRLRGQATCVPSTRLLACCCYSTVAPPQPHPLSNRSDLPARRPTELPRLTFASRKHWKDVHATFLPDSPSSVHSLSHQTYQPRKIP
jgi:hypothetical protein